MNVSAIRRMLRDPRKWIVVILASAGIWLLAFYWAYQTPSSLSFQIWVGAKEQLIDDSLSEKLNKICSDSGMKKFEIRTYDPDDYYYPQAFALEQRSVEIFILQQDDALVIAETGLFMVMPEELWSEDSVQYNGDTIGINISENYCVLINSMSKKSDTLLSEVVKAIVLYGG